MSDTLSDSALDGHVFVIHGMDHLTDRRRGHFKADGRLEMVLTAVLRSTPTVRIIMTARRTPQLYNEGAMAGLRTLELGGLKGKVLHEMFTAHHLEDIPREKFGPIHDRTLGHPLAARYLAISALEDGDLDEILDQGRYLKVNDLDRAEAVTRHIKRRIDKLKDSDRKALAAAALFRDPATTDDLRVFDIDRRTRLYLISQGLLEQTPVDGDRRYYVHPSVSRHLEYREIFDFDNMQALGRQMHNHGRDAPRRGTIHPSAGLSRSKEIAYDRVSSRAPHQASGVQRSRCDGREHSGHDSSERTPVSISPASGSTRS